MGRRMEDRVVLADDFPASSKTLEDGAGTEKMLLSLLTVSVSERVRESAEEFGSLSALADGDRRRSLKGNPASPSGYCHPGPLLWLLLLPSFRQVSWRRRMSGGLQRSVWRFHPLRCIRHRLQTRRTVFASI